MKPWACILAALPLAACGARSELSAPAPDFVEPGRPPAYCQDAGETAIYVVTDANELWRFDPPTAAFTPVGPVSCPLPTGSTATPFSMAVDHQGTAYVVFDDGELFTLSTATAACTPTSTPIDASAFTKTFGMGFTADPGGLTETLFIASTRSPGQLGTLDTATFVAHPIGPFSSDIAEAELTGTGDGRLFAFGVNPMASGAHLAEIDTTNAGVLTDTMVPMPLGISAWAFGFWGGDFYFFTGVGGAPSTVGRYHPADGSFDATYAMIPNGGITGAGVSTCAPR